MTFRATLTATLGPGVDTNISACCSQLAAGTGQLLAQPLEMQVGCDSPCTPVPRQPGARTLIAMAGAGSVRAAPAN